MHKRLAFTFLCGTFLGNDLKSLTSTVLDAIALPITEHEVVEIWLAHDMVGYVGLKALVKRSFAKVMEQTAASEVVVRKGDGTHSEDVDPEERQLNACDGYEQAVKLAKVRPKKEKKKQSHFGFVLPQ